MSLLALRDADIRAGFFAPLAVADELEGHQWPLQMQPPPHRRLPNLWPYLRDLYQHDGVAATVSFDHIKRHYYMTHDEINPTRIVPIAPALDLQAPHERERVRIVNGDR